MRQSTSITGCVRWSVGRSVGWLVGPHFTFFMFLRSLASRLLPQCSSYSNTAAAHPHATGGLVIFHPSPFCASSTFPICHHLPWNFIVQVMIHQISRVALYWDISNKSHLKESLMHGTHDPVTWIVTKSQRIWIFYLTLAFDNEAICKCWFF